MEVDGDAYIRFARAFHVDLSSSWGKNPKIQWICTVQAAIPNLGPLNKAVRPEALPADAGAITRLRVLMTLASLPVLCLWIAPMGSSLWLDELVTYWSVYKGVVPSIARSQSWPGLQTPYMVLVAAIVRLMGTSE